MDLKKYLLAFKKKFDPKLDQFLVKKQKLAKKLASDFEQAVEEIRRLNQAGGKRIRPALIYTAFKAYGGKNNKEIWQACIAMELIQTFALLHDDIMDNAKERRGEITCFKKLGLNKAILAGDVALILAEGLIPARAKKYFDLMKWEVAGGQWLDISQDQRLKIKDQNDKSKFKDKNIFKIMKLKSAMYTIARPLQIGAALGGALAKNLKAFFDYGKNVGIAFQMKDNVLDEEVSKTDLQKYLKKAGGLSEEGKKALENVKIRQKEKQFLLDLADFAIERKQ